MDVDTSITFTDTQGESIKVSNFSSYDSTSFDLAFGLVSRAGHSPELIVGLEMNSKYPWSKIRNEIIELLQRLNVFMKPHNCITWTSVDVVNIGHVHLSHPRFTNIEELQTNFGKMLRTASNKASMKDNCQLVRQDRYLRSRIAIVTTKRSMA